MIGQLIDRIDLSIPFSLAVLAGTFLSVFLAQVSWGRDLERGDPHWLLNIRRAGYLLQALSFIWALAYGIDHQWQPWPPFVAIVIMLDANIVIRIATVYQRKGKNIGKPSNGNASLAR